MPSLSFASSLQERAQHQQPEPLPECGLLELYPRGDPGRPQVEAFIRTVYAKRFGASIPAFAPVLVACRIAGEIVSAAGYRSADEPLYLERYLEQPIESLLGPSSRATRSRIVEVGHLAAARPGEGRRLIAALADHLTALDVEWVVSTVTAELRQLVVRLGIGAIAIAPADPVHLGSEAASWGSYFSNEPLVMASHLPTAMRGMRRRTCNAP